MIVEDKTKIYLNSDIDTELKDIAKKVITKERITVKEGLALFEKGDLGFLGSLANHIRTKKHGNYTYFNLNEKNTIYFFII